MSDDDEEYSYEYDDDDVDMDDNDGCFEYTDEDDEADDAEVALENTYYNSKGLRETDLVEAASSFETVIQMEKEELVKNDSIKKYGKWSYKAIKQLVKLHLRTGNSMEMMKHYHRLLDCIAEGDVSPNAIEKGINGMLERVSSLYQGAAAAVVATGTGSATVDNNNNMHSQNENERMNPQQMALAVYDATLRVFHPRSGVCPNERLWFKTNLKYGQLLYEINETPKLQQVLKDLKNVQRGIEQQSSPTSPGGGGGGGASSSTSTSTSTTITSTQSMEIYALQIQLYSRQKDNKKLREVFNKAMAVRGGIPHPRTLALIQELGGKMHMAAREYESAGKTFFQAFKSYDEAGDPSRLRCLKYLVLASMLHASSINPFDSQEARPYRDDPEIVAMTNLVQAFHNNEIQTFERILRINQGRIMEDPFVREHIEDLLRTIRTQVLCRVIRPYTRISLQAIARELNDIPIHDVETLLVSLILDGKLNGHIDQVNAVLIKHDYQFGLVTKNLMGPHMSSLSSSSGPSSSTTPAGAAASGVAGAGAPGASVGAGGPGSAASASAAVSDKGNTRSQSSFNNNNNSTTTDAVSGFGGRHKSLIVQQCEAMEQLIKTLDEFSSSLTNARIKEGSPMRGPVH